LERLGINDPRLQVISEFLQKQSMNSNNENPVERRLSREKETLDKFENLVQQYKVLADKNKYLNERVEIVAAALGACPHCWGEDNSCASCRGLGRPGHFLPDRGVFAGYVIPAVRTLHRSSQKARSSVQERRDAEQG